MHADDLTLTRAVELARERSPQRLAREAIADAARSRVIAAGRLPDPELVIGLDNVPVEGMDAWSLTNDFMTMRRVGVMQPVPNGHKRAAQRRSAQAEVELASSEIRQTDLEISQAAAQAWVDVLASERLLASLNALEPELRLQSDAALAEVRSGRASSVEALAVRSRLVALQGEILDARRDSHASRAALVRWIGEEGQTIKLVGDPGLDRLPVESDVLGKLHRHAAFVTYEAQIELARSEVEMARAEKRPDWAAGIAYSKRGSAFDDMVSLEFRVGLPLFTGNRQNPLVRAKQAEIARIEAEREDELRMHAEEVAHTIAEWEAARDRIHLLDAEGMPLARERTKAALASYRAGTQRLADALESIEAEIELQKQYADLTRELGRAWAMLRYLDTQGETP